MEGWVLTEAIQLCGILFHDLWAAGWTVGLTGSVLLNGHSLKDLDLILYPLNATRQDKNAAIEVLKKSGMTPFLSETEVKKTWTRKRSNDTKHVEIWIWGNKRVDIFFLS